MGTNGEDARPSLNLRLTQKQDQYLFERVEKGEYLSKQEAIRALIDKEMREKSLV
jgi:Arc/MetJ-type ribon-helix-helix transcriptional regulator